MVSSFNTTDQNRDVIPGCGPMLRAKTASVSVGVDLQEQKRSFDNNSIEPLCGLRPVTVRNGKRLGGADDVADWMRKIKKVWARGASSTLDLARVVSAAKNRLQRQYGQWTRLWKSEQKMPVSKRTADMLAVIGEQMGELDWQTSANLPRGWNILYQLARLDSQTLEQLIQQGVVHPKLTLSHAKDLVAEFTGKQTAAERRKASVRERLRRFAEFVRDTVSDWEIQEREFATETLTQLMEEIGVSETAAFKRDRSTSAFCTQPGLLTDQRIKL